MDIKSVEPWVMARMNLEHQLMEIGTVAKIMRKFIKEDEEDEELIYLVHALRDHHAEAVRQFEASNPPRP